MNAERQSLPQILQNYPTTLVPVSLCATASSKVALTTESRCLEISVSWWAKNKILTYAYRSHSSQPKGHIMNRRIFITNAGLLTTWLGVSIALHGCSSYGDDDNPTDPGSGGDGSVSGSIGSNHGHSVAITSAQMMAGNAVTLTLSGGGHTHAVTFN
ncbi:MAG: hypothetical protein ACI9UK_001492 [Candidatus Krumholzibacteriia bacterium]|jgi:hypothetical protein